MEAYTLTEPVNGKQLFLPFSSTTFPYSHRYVLTYISRSLTSIKYYYYSTTYIMIAGTSFTYKHLFTFYYKPSPFKNKICFLTQLDEKLTSFKNSA